MSKSLKRAWNDDKLLLKGCKGQHQKNNLFKFKKNNGGIAASDCKNLELAADHFN